MGNLVVRVEMSEPVLPVEVVPLTRVELNQLQCVQVRRRSGRRDVFCVSCQCSARILQILERLLAIYTCQPLHGMGM